MDNFEQGSQRGASRLSRLPLPRAIQAVNVPDIHQDTVQKTSNIPRPLGTGSLRLKGNTPLSEAANQSLRSRYGWSQQQPRNKSPDPESLQAFQTASLETTPPSENVIQYVEGDENSVTTRPIVRNQKRRSRPKPRPSLSERTVETLSQLPPSPSPSGRRPSITANDTNSTTQSRPSSSMRSSRPKTSANSGRSSPSKQQRRPSGRLPSPDAPPLPSGPDYGQIYTPPRALLKGSNIAKPSRDNRRSGSVAKQDTEVESAIPKVSSYAYRAKSMYDLRGAASKGMTPRPSLASIFQEPKKAQSGNSKLPTQSYFDSNAGNGLMKPRSPGDNVIAPSTPPKVSATQLPARCTKNHSKGEKHVAEQTLKAPKSSLSLRETIAQAKAAKKAAAKKAALSNPATSADAAVFDAQGEFAVESPVDLGGSKTLQKRIEGAVTSGTLNIAAMNLKVLPEEIQKMYEFNPNAGAGWAEAVDLTKLIAADNQLEELSENLFPDWSQQELQDDDEKTNQFGGLQVLDLHGNRLRTLPIGLRRLEHLHTLNLSNNHLAIDALDVICQIPNLRELNLSNNSFEGQIPEVLTQLAHLQTLNLHSNKLTGLPDTIAEMSELRRLDISNNKIEHVPASSLQDMSLSELNLSKNKISGTLFREMKANSKLQLLDVSSNRLQVIYEDILEFSALQSLICDSNQLRTLPDLTRAVSLVNLTASENQIEDLPSGFTDLKNLCTANLSVNQIKVLDPSISQMDSLRTFNITTNPLRDRKYLAMSTDDLKVDLAKRLPTTEVEQNTNGLGSEYGNVGSTMEAAAASPEDAGYTYRPENGVLNLSSLNLSSIDIMKVDLTRPIHSIRLSNNDLTKLPEELLQHAMVKYSLKSLDVSHNPSLHSTAYLTSDVSLPVLRSLYFVSTGLTSLEALTTHLVAPELRELNISCHRMSGHVPWVKAWFPSITTLLATDNWFTSIDVECIRGLEVVDISNNDIDYLPPKIGELGHVEGSKSQAGRLRVFECSGNRFRVPRLAVIEKGTEAILRDLRRMVPLEQVSPEWRD